jgi:hypothetical protein
VHVGVAAVLLRPDVRDVLLGDRRMPRPDRAAALAIRIRLVRTGAQPAHLLESRDDLEHDPDARHIGHVLREDRRLLDLDAAIAQAMERLLVTDDRSRERSVLALDDRRVAIAADRHEPPLEAVEPPLLPLLREPANPVVVGRRAPQRQARRCGEHLVDDEPVRVDLDRGCVPVGRPGRERSRGYGDLAPADLETGRCPRELERRFEPNRDERLAGVPHRRLPVREFQFGRLPGRDLRQVDRCLADDVAVDGQRVAGTQPTQARKMLGILDLKPAAFRGRTRHPHRRRQLLVLPQGGFR